MTLTNIYATGADTQAFLNSLGGPAFTLGTASVPTLAQVEGWLDALSAEVDSILKSRGYGTVPASGVSDKLLIGRYVSQKGAAMAFKAGFINELPEKVKTWEAEWEKFLERLIDNKYQLVDQVPISRTGSVMAKVYTEDD